MTKATEPSRGRVLLLPGWFSDGSRKAGYLRALGYAVLCPRLSDWTFARAVRTARAAHATFRPDVVVGASRGGAAASGASSGGGRGLRDHGHDQPGGVPEVAARLRRGLRVDTIELADGGLLLYDQAFLPTDLARRYFAELRDDTPWKQNTATFGRLQPRLSGCMLVIMAGACTGFESTKSPRPSGSGST